MGISVSDRFKKKKTRIAPEAGKVASYRVFRKSDLPLEGTLAIKDANGSWEYGELFVPGHGAWSVVEGRLYFAAALTADHEAEIPAIEIRAQWAGDDAVQLSTFRLVKAGQPEVVPETAGASAV